MKCPQCHRDDCPALDVDASRPTTVDDHHAMMDCDANTLPRGFYCPPCGDGTKLAEGERCVYCGVVGDGIPF